MFIFVTEKHCKCRNLFYDVFNNVYKSRHLDTGKKAV